MAFAARAHGRLAEGATWWLGRGFRGGKLVLTHKLETCNRCHLSIAHRHNAACTEKTNGVFAKVHLQQPQQRPHDVDVILGVPASPYVEAIPDLRMVFECTSGC
eukprot:12778538-Alexandrium_andersonii.AAC.1